MGQKTPDLPDLSDLASKTEGFARSALLKRPDRKTKRSDQKRKRRDPDRTPNAFELLCIFSARLSGMDARVINPNTGRWRRHNEPRKAGVSVFQLEIDNMFLCEALKAAELLHPDDEDDREAVRDAPRQIDSKAAYLVSGGLPPGARLKGAGGLKMFATIEIKKRPVPFVLLNSFSDPGALS